MKDATALKKMEKTRQSSPSLKEVAPGQLNLSLARFRLFNRVAIERMKQSLVRYGQLSPLIAASHDDGSLCLIDGFKRQRAALQLGLSALTVEELKLSPSSMKAQVYLRNRTSGFDFFEECLLITELHDLDGLPQVAIGDLLHRHKSWVCRRLQFMDRISPWLLEDVRLGLLQAGSARKLALLPRGNQEEVAVAVKVHRLGVKETERLVRLYQQAPTAEAKHYVLSSPREALSPVLLPRSSGKKDRSPELTKLLNGFAVICQLSRTIKKNLDRSPDVLGTVFKKQLQEACRLALAALIEVKTHLDKSPSEGGQ
jgi:ParB-like chromosome segregation protein Spo0J